MLSLSLTKEFFKKVIALIINIMLHK